jgi:hypothetical protein
VGASALEQFNKVPPQRTIVIGFHISAFTLRHFREVCPVEVSCSHQLMVFAEN